MARGWESKSIESQQEEAARTVNRRAPLSSEARERLAKRAALTLARTRAAADLERATAAAHRRMLEQALQALDEQIAALAD
jgi:hypothetical protein